MAGDKKSDREIGALIPELTAVSDARFHSLAYMVEEAVVVTDQGNQVVFANPAADRLFEAAPGALVGSAFIMPMRSTKSGEIQVRLASGRRLKLRGTIAATVWDGKIGWLGTFEASVPEALQSAARDAALNAMRARFLAHLSHELRTPLNTIMGFSEAMAKEVFGPLGTDQYRDYARAVHTTGQRLLGLMNDLLELSRAQSGDLRLNETTFDLAQVINEALLQAKALARNGGAAIAMGQVQPVLLRADAEKIRSAVMHLLANGLAFTEATGTVTLSATLGDDRRLLIRVEDDGRGFLDEQLEQAFEPFSRVGAVELADPQAGLGVGLALVRRYIEMHGGAVRIDTQDGQGTCVTCMLPQDRVALDVAVDGTGTRH